MLVTSTGGGGDLGRFGLYPSAFVKQSKAKGRETMLRKSSRQTTGLNGGEGHYEEVDVCVLPAH